ncbi:hypothetical protein ColLi_09164 [Colletotrichum liriopes]|uniref:Uncharacterized protein n=1 Tax=Colletotrichum liriopes TaxID=708192 RepID=A0AA37GSA9_9PEZI|nr:hypothetical protein ColLi_09164 [Colletotrichum liriopes]
MSININLISQYAFGSFSTNGVINTWVQASVPPGPSLLAQALVHHIDTHSTRLNIALAAQGSAPKLHRRRLSNNL